MERGVIDGRFQSFRLRLKMTKAMIGRWHAAGLLNPDKSGVMMREHGGFGNRATDVVGKWENLRIEERGDYLALVGNPAFDDAMMRSWMTRAGVDPAAWRGIIARRTISATSVGYRVNLADMRELPTDDGVREFEAPFDFIEGSWVWKGQDTKAGMDRAHDTDNTAEITTMPMTPEEIQAMVDKAAKEGARTALAERDAATATPPATAVVTELVEPKLDDDPTWRQCVTMAGEELGPDALRAVEAARGEETIAASIASLNGAIADALKKRTSGHAKPPENQPAPVPTNHRVSGGDELAYGALVNLEKILYARGLEGTIKRGTEKQRANPKSLQSLRYQAIEVARKIDYRYASVPPLRYLVQFARARGYIDHGWYGSARDLTRTLAHEMRAPDHAVAGDMGGWYLPTADAVRSQGAVDVFESMRHGGAGLVPADLPAVYLAPVVKIFLAVHDTMMLDILGLSRNLAADDLNEVTLIRHDVALAFHEVIGEQPLPVAHRFDESVAVKTAARGTTLSVGWEAMHKDGAQTLTQVPAMLAMRWAGAKIDYWFSVLVAGLYKGANIYTGGHTANTSDLRAWFQQIRDTAALARPVPLPTDPARKLPPDVNVDVPAPGVMRPDALLIPGKLDGVFSNYFAARQSNQTGLDDTQHTEFESEIREGRRTTDYLKERKAYAIVTSGTGATITTVGLAGQGMQLTTVTDTDIRKLPDLSMRIIDTMKAEVTHPNSAYVNDVPV
jgi:hypothetical protein